MSVLPVETAKGELALAYLRAVATQCRCGVEVMVQDFGQIDAIVTARAAVEGYPDGVPVMLLVQLKSRTGLPTEGDDFRVRLERKTYDALRQDRPPGPRLLLVLALPDRWDEQIAWSPQQLCLRRCMYWCNLCGMPDVGSQETVTVVVPRRNEFGPDALMHLVNRAGAQGGIDDVT